MSFWSGLLVGIFIGIGGYYGVQKKPWTRFSQQVEDTNAYLEKDTANLIDNKHSKSKKRKKRSSRRREDRLEGESDDAGMEIVDLLAKDRMIIKKGPTIDLPDKNFDGATTGLGRSLNQNEINNALIKNQNKFIQCIKEGRGDAELRAEIKLRMLVGKSGRVEKKQIQAPRYLFDQGLSNCFDKIVSRMRFKGTGAHSVVSVPFELY